MSLLDRLIANGNLPLFEAYKAGCAFDLGGYGNHGTLVETNFNRNGARFKEITSEVSIPDSPELQLILGTLVVCTVDHPFRLGTDPFSEYITKRDAGGLNYQFFYNNSTERVALSDGVATRYVDLDLSVESINYIAANFGDGEIADLYTNGTFRDDFGVASTFSVDDAPITIGNEYRGSRRQDSGLSYALIINRKLTADEHAELYAELQALKWTTKTSHKLTVVVEESTNERKGSLWMTGYGAHESSDATTEGALENTGFRVESGSAKISRGTIENQDGKIIECVIAGLFYIPTALLGQTENDAAFGRWQLWWNKAAVNNFVLMFIDSLIGNSPQGDNYNFIHRSSGVVNLRKESTNIAGSANVYADDTWHCLDMFRNKSPLGLFNMYVNKEFNDSATDSTHTESKYIVLDMDAGDKVFLADLKGDHAIVKTID